MPQVRNLVCLIRSGCACSRSASSRRRSNLSILSDPYLLRRTAADERRIWRRKALRERKPFISRVGIRPRSSSTAGWPATASAASPRRRGCRLHPPLLPGVGAWRWRSNVTLPALRRPGAGQHDDAPGPECGPSPWTRRAHASVPWHGRCPAPDALDVPEAGSMRVGLRRVAGYPAVIVVAAGSRHSQGVAREGAWTNAS